MGKHMSLIFGLHGVLPASKSFLILNVSTKNLQGKGGRSDLSKPWTCRLCGSHTYYPLLEKKKLESDIVVLDDP